jgi:hypothetical protein
VIQQLRKQIDPLIGQIEAVMRANCQCPPCRAASGLAQQSLAYLSPLAIELAVEQEHDEAFFERLAGHMRAEIERLERTLRQVQALKCQQVVRPLATPPKPRPKPPPPRPPRPPAEPPQAAWYGGSDQLPRSRRTRGEMIDKPRIPGTFRLY